MKLFFWRKDKKESDPKEAKPEEAPKEQAAEAAATTPAKPAKKKKSLWSRLTGKSKPEEKKPDEEKPAEAEAAKPTPAPPPKKKKAAPKKARPAPEPVPEPEEPAPEPVAEEPAPEPTPEPTPESSAELAPEPVPEAGPAPAPVDDEDEKPGGWMARLRAGLGKTAKKISSGLATVIGKPALDEGDIESIEDTLVMADLGMEAASRIAQGLSKRKYPDGVTAESLADAMAEDIAAILKPVEKPLGIDDANRPHVILMVGVNGSGKTTTAGKLAEFFRAGGKSVMMAAADTFRAAAVEQLQIWGERTGTEVVTGEEGADAAAVAYRALEQAVEKNIDIVVIDTAGRLQARKELMDELAKIHRVIGKQDATAPHDSIIVLDGTVGQNALSQVEAFGEVAGLTGMIVTKLDGSAHGGVVVALAEKFGLPIHAIGVGEQKEDLQPFEAEAFARALADSHTGRAGEA